MDFKNKKILLVGLGTLGGGLATAKFLMKYGMRLTITDLRTKNELKKQISSLSRLKKKFNLVLGRHKNNDFKNNDIIVFNPAVSVFGQLVGIAKKYKKRVENDLTLFLSFLQKTNPGAKIAAITGTRGKTTVSHWIAHFLSDKNKKVVLGGNIPQKGLLQIAGKKADLFVLELSSFQLEFARAGLKPPKVAVITNLYRDHLNRYKNINSYLKAKANIFLNQTKDDFLVLNADNEFSEKFLLKKPKSSIYYFSLKKLPKNKNGLFFEESKVYFQKNGILKKIFIVSELTSHQKENLSAALLGAYLCGVEWSELEKKIKNLPKIPFRQQQVFKNKKVVIINDSASTNPEAAMAAISRFVKAEKRELILIAGGTDKNLSFRKLAETMAKNIKIKNLYLLEGSATKKLTKELKKINYFKPGENRLFSDLEAIMRHISNRRDFRGMVVFSPAAASFEKFKNEFDRGRKFNLIVKKYFK